MERTPDELTKELLEDTGYRAVKLERRGKFGRTYDFLGFADWLGLKIGAPPLLVQTTTINNRSSRVLKVLASNLAWLWVMTGSRIQVHGWNPPTKKDGAQNMDPVEITYAMFNL